jgi:hypothetical protein
MRSSTSCLPAVLTHAVIYDTIATLLHSAIMLRPAQTAQGGTQILAALTLAAAKTRHIGDDQVVCPRRAPVNAGLAEAILRGLNPEPSPHIHSLAAYGDIKPGFLAPNT